MAQPPIKRYALVPMSGADGVRRFQLARVSGDSRAADRLERMEEIAGFDGHGPEGLENPADPET